MNITLSRNFKKMALKSIGAILAFIFIYFLLFFMAVAVSVLCFVGGGLLILVFHNIISILLGLGLIGLGITILAFFLKFIFKGHTTDRTGLDEIYRTTQPHLFALIDEIVADTKTSYPKRVYLSANLNAGVFYDSNFLSLFFPVKKNLQIGVALINTVTEQELKAILAHEFGHFSQRSMSVGSYVYFVNEVIYNMLYDNDSFDATIQKWAKLSWFFSVFIFIAVKIIYCIQWILQKMYGVVNLCYLALSREMEFHADEVAANVTGSKPLEYSLLRFDLSENTFDEMLNFYGERVGNNLKSKNMFKDHSYRLLSVSEAMGIPIKNKLPYITLSDIGKYQTTKLDLEDKWSSHPMTSERVIALQKLNIVIEKLEDKPAIDLLVDADTICENYTDRLFSTINYAGEVRALRTDEFKEILDKEVQKYSFPKEYNGYYDNKSAIGFDLENILDFESHETLDTLYSSSKVEAVHNFNTFENDENVLQRIVKGDVVIKSFNYNGRRYKAEEAQDLLKSLQTERENLNEVIAKNDIEIYKFFYNRAKLQSKSDELKNLYIEHFNQQEANKARLAMYDDVINATSFLQREDDSKYYSTYFNILSREEQKLRIEIEKMMQISSFEDEITTDIRTSFDKYLSRNWCYSANETADQEYLDVLFSAINNYNKLILRSYFIERQNLFNYQISLFHIQS